MLITGILSGVLDANCWVVAAGKGRTAAHPARRECLVIDPGLGVAPAVADLCAENGLQPVAALLTHGHLDHTFAVVPVCEKAGIPAYIHPADRAQLLNPWLALGLAPGTPLFGQLEFAEPDDVRELAAGTLVLGGLEGELGLTVGFAPGHTPGSVVFGVVGDDAPVLFTGDLIFAGAVGRTDLPGGSSARLMNSLRTVVLPAVDDTVLYPGHGPATTVGTERHSNPFLRRAASGRDAGTDSRPRLL